MSTHDQKFLSTKQAAERYGLHPKTIKDYVQRGLLVAHRFGTHYRFSPQSLADFEARHLLPTPTELDGPLPAQRSPLNRPIKTLRTRPA